MNCAKIQICSTTTHTYIVEAFGHTEIFDMNGMSLEYWNELAHQLILISSLLSGFSIAVIANLLVYKSNS